MKSDSIALSWLFLEDFVKSHDPAFCLSIIAGDPSAKTGPQDDSFVS
jgi:hypothetical protein